MNRLVLNNYIEDLNFVAPTICKIEEFTYLFQSVSTHQSTSPTAELTAPLYLGQLKSLNVEINSCINDDF